MARDGRPSAAQRGYDAKWTAYSAAYRLRHPSCRPCRDAGGHTPTELVDHIVPVTGPDDPLFWSETNHQPICRECHAVKTAQEGRTAKHRVTASVSDVAPRKWVVR